MYAQAHHETRTESAADRNRRPPRTKPALRMRSRGSQPAAKDRRSPEASAYRKLYKDSRWCGKHGIRAQRLTVEPLCRMCAKAGRFTPATVADHIKEHKGNIALFYDFENTQSLCVPCHSGEKQQIERKGFSNAIGEDGWPSDPHHPANANAIQRPTSGQGQGSAWGGRIRTLEPVWPAPAPIHKHHKP